MKKISVGIIEDSVIHIGWINELLSKDINFSISFIAKNGTEGVNKTKDQAPDVIVLDFQLPDITGLEVSKRVAIYSPSTKIFALTAHKEDEILARLIDDKNISGLAVKGSNYIESNFIHALKSVSKGELYIDPSLFNTVKKRGILSKSNLNLSKREFEVFVQVSIGKSDVEVADDLSVDIAHIKNIKSRISKVMKSNSVAEYLKKRIESNK